MTPRPRRGEIARLLRAPTRISFATGKSVLLIGLALGLAAFAKAQKDPGPRPGVADAGGPFVGLSPEEVNLFWAARERFKEVNSVSGKIEEGVGLGPAFNGNSCAMCHAQPAAGGSSPSLRSPQVRRLVMRANHLVLVPETNPQVELAGLDRMPGKNQTVPPFITPDGPVRIARFVSKPDGAPDGSVHDIYTIAGRVDAPGCALPQPDFAAEMATRNLAFRIPIPTFGDGLIESVSDAALVANSNSTATQRHVVGIGGRFNRSPNDGTIMRFGWKAQNKSVLIFAAESYNVEIGATSEAFPNKRDQTPGCVFNPLPEDKTRLQSPAKYTYPPSDFASDVANFAAFMELSAPPGETTHSQSELRGKALFAQAGCGLCHSPALRTGLSAFAGMSHVVIHPYSDYALHHMGPGLADHISQESAGGDEFRTAPLWGLGQRIFFLHDGRTTDLLAAVEDHASPYKKCSSSRPRIAGGEACNSEANAVIAKFNRLSPAEKQDILNFLRSL